MYRILRTRIDLNEKEFCNNRYGKPLVFKTMNQANAYIKHNCLQIPNFIKYETVFCSEM